MANVDQRWGYGLPNQALVAAAPAAAERASWLRNLRGDLLVCYVLTRANFERLTAEHPAIAIKLLTNLGRELSSRLRRANRTIYQLAS